MNSILKAIDFLADIFGGIKSIFKNISKSNRQKKDKKEQADVERIIDNNANDKS